MRGGWHREQEEMNWEKVDPAVLMETCRHESSGLKTSRHLTFKMYFQYQTVIHFHSSFCCEVSILCSFTCIWLSPVSKQTPSSSATDDCGRLSRSFRISLNLLYSGLSSFLISSQSLKSCWRKWVWFILWDSHDGGRYCTRWTTHPSERELMQVAERLRNSVIYDATQRICGVQIGQELSVSLFQFNQYMMCHMSDSVFD